jgi:hypothetical protein
MWYIARGFLDAILDTITQRKTLWHKTERFRTNSSKAGR